MDRYFARYDETGLLNRFSMPIVADERSRLATIRDVARAAGVSPATVSRYLNKTILLPPARPEDRARLRGLAYRPNRLAQRLSTGAPP